MKHTFISSCLISGLIGLLIITPLFPTVAAANFQPRTQEEQLAFLYGQLALLLAQLERQQQMANGDAVIQAQRNPFNVRVTTAAPERVSLTTAELRGEIDRGTAPFITVWTEYGIGNVLNERTTEQTVTLSGRRAVAIRLENLRVNTTYRYRLVARDSAGNVIVGQTRTFTTSGTWSSSESHTVVQPSVPITSSVQTQSVSPRTLRNPYFVQSTTLAPVRIGRENAELRGEIDRGASSEVIVWMEYGRGNTLTNRSDLQTITRVGRQTVSFTLEDLRSNTTYSYRLVAEDVDGNLIIGQTRTFTTIAPTAVQTFRGRPTTETEGVTNVNTGGATVQGFVSMNDFASGRVFFVFGSDRNRVVNLERLYNNFSEIPTVRGEFGTRVVHARFSGRNTVTTNLSGLPRATLHYYRVCVEYTEQDRTQLTCGNTETFTIMN